MSIEPFPTDLPLDLEELSKRLREVIDQLYVIKRRPGIRSAKYSGPDLHQYLRATNCSLSERFTQSGLKRARETCNADAMDKILETALQLGISNGLALARKYRAHLTLEDFENGIDH